MGDLCNPLRSPSGDLLSDIIRVLGMIALGFICSPAIGKRLTNFILSFPLENPSPMGFSTEKNPQKSQNAASQFYTNKWQLITDLVEDKLHSHIGGYSQTILYLDKLSLKPTDRVLDIGCGYGGFLIEAALRKGCNGAGFDLVPDRIEKAKEVSRSLNLDPKLTFFNEDFLSDKVILSRSFDIAVILDVIIHIGDKQKVISKASSSLRENGKLLVADYFTAALINIDDDKIFRDPAMNG